MPEDFGQENEAPKPIHRNERSPLKINLGYGSGKEGESIQIKYKPDRDSLLQAADQGYDIRPLTEEELKTSNKRLLTEYHTLFKEMPESSEGYEEAWDTGGSEKEFTFKKGEVAYRVRFGVNDAKVPFLTVDDITEAADHEDAIEKGVPEEELLDEDEIAGSEILGINHEFGTDLYLACEGWVNNQEALRSANEWQQELREGK